MREIRPSGSEGGGELRLSPYPYRGAAFYCSTDFPVRAFAFRTDWEVRASAPAKVVNRRGASPRREEFGLS